MKKNNIISDWLDQYGNPEIDKFVETQLNQNKMNYELTAKANTWDRTFTIRLKYTKGIEKYRTDRLTEAEFNVMSTYTPQEWEIYLDTADNYKKI